jgi:hypothetical protein
MTEQLRLRNKPRIGDDDVQMGEIETDTVETRGVYYALHAFLQKTPGRGIAQGAGLDSSHETKSCMLLLRLRDIDLHV